MKSFYLAALCLIPILFTACEGSDVYRGEWYAMDSEGNKSTLVFTPENMTLVTESGETESYEYSQNRVSIENGTRLYGINMNNGRSYNIVFPIKGNTEKGVVTDGHDNILFIIGRSDYYTYDEVYGLSAP